MVSEQDLHTNEACQRLLKIVRNTPGWDKAVMQVGPVNEEGADPEILVLKEPEIVPIEDNQDTWFVIPYLVLTEMYTLNMLPTVVIGAIEKAYDMQKSEDVDKLRQEAESRNDPENAQDPVPSQPPVEEAAKFDQEQYDAGYKAFMDGLQCNPPETAETNANESFEAGYRDAAESVKAANENRSPDAGEVRHQLDLIIDATSGHCEYDAARQYLIEARNVCPAAD